MTMTFTSADGATSGSFHPGAPGRPLLACIHGGGCNARYFDLKGRSVLEAAQARGLPVLLVDRPGYGGNPRLAADEPVAVGAPIVARLLAEVLAGPAAGADGLFIIGHSIGGATAVEIAAAGGGLPLLGIAVSGMGDEAPEELRKWDPEQFKARSQPDAATASLYLGPEGTYSWQALAAFRRAADEWTLAEAVEMIHRWPLRWPALAAKVAVPVHLRLAEHDKVWETGDKVVERLAAALTSAPLVDSALLPDGGHIYEVHRRGPELIADQLDFLERVSPPAPARAAQQPR